MQFILMCSPVIEKIKLLYKGENKRNSQDVDTTVVNRKRKVDNGQDMNEDQVSKVSQVSDSNSWFKGPLNNYIDKTPTTNLKIRFESDEIVKKSPVNSDEIKSFDKIESRELNEIKSRSIDKNDEIQPDLSPNIKSRMVGWTNSAQQIMPPIDSELEATKISGRTVPRVGDSESLVCRSVYTSQSKCKPSTNIVMNSIDDKVETKNIDVSMVGNDNVSNGTFEIELG